MGTQGITVIEIWSSDDDAGGERTSETGKKGPLEKENKIEKRGRLEKEKRTGKKGPREKENRTQGIMVIEIWSSDDDAAGERTSETGKKGPLEKENKTEKKGRLEKENRTGKELLEIDNKTGKEGVEDMGDLECVVLDGDPFDTVHLSRKLSTYDTDQDFFVLAESGQVACRDYPHSRHLCVKFPFSQTLHESYCEQCYCYVCDSKAPCKYWKGTETEHCHASDKETKWSLRREARRKPLSAQDEEELTRREIIDTFACLPFFEYHSEDHPGAFEYNGARPNVQDSGAVRKTGTVKSFSDETGRGFITPYSSVDRHHSFRASSVMLDGSSCGISRGDIVEYEVAPNGVAEAVKIIRPASHYGKLRDEARISHQKTLGASHGRGRLTGTVKWFCSEKGYVSEQSQATGDGEGRRDRREQAVTAGAADRHSHLVCVRK